MTNASAARIGVLWRGKPGDEDPELSETRLSRVFEALTTRSLSGVAVVYTDEAVERAREQLLGVDAGLVWVDPISDGQDRSLLDPMLRDVASRGVVISAHPDVILKMGTKEVLVQTRDMGWGSDCFLYKSLDEMRDQLPELLALGPRVLKQHRGNDGSGVWKVELAGDRSQVYLREARRRSGVFDMTLDEALDRFAPYFDNDGCIIDQPYQDLTRGMVRCYLVQDRVAGFGQQYVTALAPLPPGESETPLPQPRLYYGPYQPEFQALKQQLESGWVAEMQRILDIDTDSLPMIWDADFLYGPKDAAGNDTFVLCEINVSSVFPFPDEALEPLADAVLHRVTQKSG